MIVAGRVGALIATVLAVIELNFVTGEKQFQRKSSTTYAIDDAQLRCELGTLAGPPIIDCKRVTNLENGIEVLPAMLKAENFPALRAGLWRPGASLHQLAERRRRQHSACVPAFHDGGRVHD